MHTNNNLLNYFKVAIHLPIHRHFPKCIHTHTISAQVNGGHICMCGKVRWLEFAIN